MTQKAKIAKEKGNYRVTIPTKTEEVAVLNKDKTSKLDDDGEPIMEIKVLESVSCELKIDFETLKKAHGKISKFDKKMNFVGLDTIAPGEELLTFAGIQDEGWSTIMADPFLKMSASTALFEIVNEIKVGEITKN